jgi:hypothetical protein
VGVYPYTWGDLLSDCLAACSADERFCEALPVGFLEPSAAPAVRGRFAELLVAFAELADVDMALGRRAEELISRRAPDLAGYFSALEAASAVTLETQVRHRSGAMVRIDEDPRDPRLIRLSFDGGASRFDSSLRESLAFIAHNTAFEVGSIPGKIAPFHKIVLVRTLVREGLLSLVGD